MRHSRLEDPLWADERNASLVKLEALHQSRAGESLAMERYLPGEPVKRRSTDSGVKIPVEVQWYISVYAKACQLKIHSTQNGVYLWP